MRLIVVLAVVCVSVVESVANPTSFDDVNVEFWAGEGQGAQYEAVLVVDFEHLGGSYAFGYGWSGTNGVIGQTLLDGVAVENKGFSYEFSTDFGAPYVDAMTYNTITAGEYPYNGDNWLYSYVSPDGQNWDDSQLLGVSVDVITAGSYYGWSAQNSSAWPPANTPHTPVPEPGTISLFAMGAGLAVWRKRRGKKV